jgi:hypothetical protein
LVGAPDTRAAALGWWAASSLQRGGARVGADRRARLRGQRLGGSCWSGVLISLALRSPDLKAILLLPVLWSRRSRELNWVRLGGLSGGGLREKSLARGHDGGDACGHHSLAGGAVEVVPLPLPIPCSRVKTQFPLGMGGVYASGVVPFLKAPLWVKGAV